MKKKIAYILLFLSSGIFIHAQQAVPQQWWHGKERNIHYLPSGNDFICANGKMRFNRALYGTNTGFRVEAGDLPEFALYMPGMGGNFKFGLISGSKSKWLIEAQSIKATYRPGSMLYEIKDPLMGNAVFYITVLALADGEGMIIKTKFTGVNINNKATLLWAFGGASGKKFSRDGDIGADPESSFYLHPEYCKDNAFNLQNNSFKLFYGSGKILTEEQRYEIDHLKLNDKNIEANKNPTKELWGIVPVTSDMMVVDAAKQSTPLELIQSSQSETPAIAGRLRITNGDQYFLLQNPLAAAVTDYAALPQVFSNAEAARKKLADRIKLVTPDKWLNTLGGALAIAADAIWEDPSYMHGAIAWRMRLNAWRGAYVADPLGWHDRSRKHFSSYALSQVTTPPITGVVMDTVLHLARHQEKIGTALFSDGYICRNPNGDIRAHHYDMNLVFIDQLLNHFNYTGDIEYVKQMWPLLKRHLAWEKRNFDADDDGLYDAYAAIWASDALQYSGGGVTHSSAYNYRAFKMAAELAKLLGEDGEQYEKESSKIFNAIQKNLWLPRLGWYAEYKDLLGNQLVHPYPGIWTIYHAIDSKVPDAFKAYQSLQYINTVIPHIPVQANGLADKSMYVIATTNWQPYTWSLNNVALAENHHTALAFWQGGQHGEGYRLWRSALIESMYLSSSPGGFQQLSFYDAVRGELYRDFADPVSMVARTLVEGLFGVKPNALKDTLTIEPGFPAGWNYASLKVPDISIDYKKKNQIDSYIIIPSFPKKMGLQLKVKASMDGIASITVNGKKANFSQSVDAIELPILTLNIPYAPKYSIEIAWKGGTVEKAFAKQLYEPGEAIQLQYKIAGIMDVFDPQNTLSKIQRKARTMDASVNASPGYKTFFVKLKQGQLIWWQPVSFKIKSSEIINNRKTVISNSTIFETVKLQNYYNDKVTNIFKQQYLSPRPASPTLQLPTQGIGNWCYPLIQPTINDEGLRKLAGDKNEIFSPQQVPFNTPTDSLLNNIVFTSQWDNYPRQIVIPLTGSATHIHLLMAGSTNAMQSRLINGEVIMQYKDGSGDTLQLTNPQNWWPIEQDYFIDSFAFTTDAPIPLRLYLQQGRFLYGLEKYSGIKGFSNRAIEGGAATVLDMPLKAGKELQSLTLKTIANDVVIGLMSVTLQRGGPL